MTSLILTGLNLLVFIIVTLMPWFQAIHHHWIFPVLALVFSLEWGTAVFSHHKAARATSLFTLSFLLLMGIVRHQSVLICPESCGTKLGLAALLSGLIFIGQGRLHELGFWNVVRSQVAGLGALVWAGYLFMRGVGLTDWILEFFLIGTGLLLWLGRRRRANLVIALAIPLLILIGNLGNEWAIIFFSFLIIGSVFWLSKNWKDPVFQGKKSSLADKPNVSSRLSLLLRSVVRIAMLVLALMGLFHFLIGPIRQNLSYEGRRKTLLRAEASRKAPPAPDRLSPLANRLREHVVAFSETIGERPIYMADAMAKSRDKILTHFRDLGYEPRVQDYQVKGGPLLPAGKSFVNIEVILGKVGGENPDIWVVGAHYDTAPGTPGADDNASGVAVLLELGRLLKGVELTRELRLVAFCTEEPPSFGTRNMGSYHYAQGLKSQRARLKAMISLEMLGYYSDQPNSQLYPPFLHLFYPDRGNFVSLVSDVKSRHALRRVRDQWRAASPFPLETLILPAPLSTIAMSDQLNFWEMGFPALMLSDTSFYRNPHYHQESDTANTLDYERMSEITQALAAILKS